SKKDLRYKIKIKETTNWMKQLYKQQKIKIFVLAYADNMIWLVANKSMLRKITEKVSEFFEINNIQINGKKSKLVILNSSVQKEESQVTFGSEIVKAENIVTTTRFLKVC
ncbi:3825_t:CDS:1, partial [Gigaspora margarita]